MAEEKKGKRQRTGRKHSTVNIYKFYEVSDGGITRKKKSCPRCGPGTFLSEHKKRVYCGKCAYTVFDKKEPQESTKSEESKETPKEDSKQKQE